METLMYSIASEKYKYYAILVSELKNKYAHKQRIEMLYEQKKDDEWTNYQSIKRKMVKKAMNS